LRRTLLLRRTALIGLSLCVLTFSSCSVRPEAPSVSESTAGTLADVERADTSHLTDLSRMDGDPRCSFVFTDSSVECSGASDGFELQGTALKINAPGTYRLSGTCADGSVTVAKDLADVFLILDGLQLSSSTGPALTCNKSSSVCLYLQPGSKNTLSDPSFEHEEGAALKFKAGAALLLAGDGALSVSGNGKNGIKGGAGCLFRMVSGNLTVTAVNNALACDNHLQIDGGTLTLTSKNDGIKASPDEGDTVSVGNIEINGGSVTVSAVGDGISASGLFTLSGGIVNVTTTGEVSSSSGNSFGPGGMGGFPGFRPGKDSSNDSAEATDEASSKGVKSSTAMKIAGGNLTVSSTDHALHCGGEAVVEGGILRLASSAGKGIATHGDLTVSGDSTEIEITDATEGIESKQSFTMNGGTVRITCSDDGVNMGGTVSADTASSHAFTVNGGSLFCCAQGDGIDSNGSFTVNGGTVVVFGSPNGGNSCLDIQYTSEFNGGTLLAAASSSSMWNEVIGHTKGDYLYHLSAGRSTGNTVISVCDSGGTELISAVCPLTGTVGLYFMTDRVEPLSDCFFTVDGVRITPESGTGTGSSGMGGPGGGFSPGGGDHGGGPGGRR